MTDAVAVRKRRSRWFLGVTLLVIAVSAGLYYWRDLGEPAKPARGGEAGRPVTVSAEPVTVMDMPEQINVIGSALASNTAVVRPRVEGVLQAIRFQEGQHVKAGELIAQLDPAPFEAALRTAQGNAERDAALLANAELDLRRFEDLWAKDSISRQQLDTQGALVRQLRGTVESARAALDQARLNLSYTQVRAPIDGRLGLRQADVGNLVRPSDTTGLVSITQTQPIAVVFAVPDLYVDRINAALRARQSLPVEAWDKTQQTRLAEGRVASTDNAIEPATGTLRVKALFANRNDALFPNQFVQVRLRLGVQKNALTVPVAAIQRGSDGSFVYVLNDDKTVTLRRVATGLGDGKRIVVTGDLQAGARVVTEGADRLRDGAKATAARP